MYEELLFFIIFVQFLNIMLVLGTFNMYSYIIDRMNKYHISTTNSFLNIIKEFNYNQKEVEQAYEEDEDQEEDQEEEYEEEQEEDQELEEDYNEEEDSNNKEECKVCEKEYKECKESSNSNEYEDYESINN